MKVEYYVLRCKVYQRRDGREFLVADCDHGKDDAKNRLRANIIADALTVYEETGKPPSALVRAAPPASKFRPDAWNPEDRDRRLRELVELFDGRIVDGEGGGMSIYGLSKYYLDRIEHLILSEFPGSGAMCDQIRTNSFIPSSQETPGG